MLARRYRLENVKPIPGLKLTPLSQRSLATGRTQILATGLCKRLRKELPVTEGGTIGAVVDVSLARLSRRGDTLLIDHTHGSRV